MPDFNEIHIFCQTCQGTGVKQTTPTGSISCPACGGDGKILYSYLNTSELAKKDEVETQINALDIKLDALDVKLDAILVAVAP